MIRVTIRDDEPIGQFIEARAAQSGRNPEEIAEEIIREGFIALVRSLHEQFMRGEISQGHMAELLGISRIDLIHLLDTLELQVTNL
jgi:hypothetical protein